MSTRSPDDPRFAPISLRRELIAQGWTDRAIDAQVKAGAWARVRRGAYVDGPAWEGLDTPGRHELVVRAVLKQAKTKLVASHVSGLPFFEAPTWKLDLTEADVTRLDGKAGRREAGVRQHRGVILPGDVVSRHGVRVMHPTRLCLEVTMVAGIEESLVVANDLLHREWTTLERVQERYARSMDSWRGTRATDVVLRLADPRIESVGESRTYYLCWTQHVPMPTPNYKVRDAFGRVLARVDFAWPELCLFVEFDGKVKYLKYRRKDETVTDAVLREKRREEMICELTGWRCLRLVWSDLDRPAHTADRIRRLFRSPASRPA
jgi:hypothetical protein